MTNRNTDVDRKKDANPDPITGAPGSHPVGTGLGAAAGGIAGGIGAGALAGSTVGPVGTVVGAAVGAVAGGLVCKGVAEAVDPTVEEEYWRGNYANRPYVKKGASFDDYAPAYRHGVDAYGQSNGRTFEQSEPDLERSWEKVKGDSRLSWDEARDASRDSWQRARDTIERAVPGDSDRDGR
jgi:phage tail tape-measure protein